MGVPPIVIHWDFPWNNPSSYWGSPRPWSCCSSHGMRAIIWVSSRRGSAGPVNLKKGWRGNGNSFCVCFPMFAHFLSLRVWYMYIYTHIYTYIYIHIYIYIYIYIIYCYFIYFLCFLCSTLFNRVPVVFLIQCPLTDWMPVEVHATHRPSGSPWPSPWIRPMVLATGEPGNELPEDEDAWWWCVYI